MNIMNQLTMKHLKMNKKRTLMTILGVIISVAMLTSVSTASSTFIDLLQRHEIDNSGKWHVRFNQVTHSQLELFDKIDDVESIYYSFDLGFAMLNKEQTVNPNKPFLYLRSYDSSALNDLGYKLVEGTYATKAGEIVLSKHLSENGGVDYKVGDSITLDVGRRLTSIGDTSSGLTQLNPYYEENNELFQVDYQKTYEVVGIIERPSSENYSAPGYTAITSIDMSSVEGLETGNKNIEVSLFFRDIKSGFYDKIEEFSSLNNFNIELVRYNDSLLLYYGSSMDEGIRIVINGLALLLILIIMLGSISLIYNSFAISITERTKQFGILASVGATKEQKRNSIFFEGAVIGGIAIPIGIAAGLFGMAITYFIVGPMFTSAMGINVPLILKISYESLLIAVIFSILTIFISAYIPASKASRISPLDAIRQSKDIKDKKGNQEFEGISRRKRKIRTFLTMKIFGIEGMLAIRNLNRHKRRYHTLVFSLVTSLVLFLAVGSYVFYTKKMVEMTHSDYAYDLAVSVYEEDENLFKKFAKLDSTQKISQVNYITYHMEIDKEILEERITKGVEDLYFAEERNYGFSEEVIQESYEEWISNGYMDIIALDDEAYKIYREEVGYKSEDINQTTNRDLNFYEGIFINELSTIGNIDKKEVTIMNVKKRDKIRINHKVRLIDDSNIKDVNTILHKENIEIEFIEVTDRLPYGISKSNIYQAFQLIVSKSEFLRLEEYLSTLYEDRIPRNRIIYLMDIEDDDGIEEKLRSILKSEEIINYDISNLYKDKKQEEQIINVFSVFAYGFITLISLICVTNLCNTISTSFALRRREFAMLKSMGMTRKSFIKMIYLESIMYGLKALIIGLPLGGFITYLVYDVIGNNFNFDFVLPWTTYSTGVSFIIGVVGIAILYSSSKIKNESIIGGLKSEIL